MLVIFIILFIWNLLSGISNLVSYGKNNNIANGLVGGMCIFMAGVVLVFIILKSAGILP